MTLLFCRTILMKQQKDPKSYKNPVLFVQPAVIVSLCRSQEHNRLVTWYYKCIHCKGTNEVTNIYYNGGWCISSIQITNKY
jgi:hypothetical protein